MEKVVRERGIFWGCTTRWVGPMNCVVWRGIWVGSEMERSIGERFKGVVA